MLRDYRKHCIHNVDLTIEILENLSQMGISIAIDDFGTGYSSFTSLKRLPINIIKIDKSFISDMCSDIDNTAIVNAIISMSHILGLKVVAEGVETEQQLALLRDLGCDAYQGYLKGKPMMASQLEEYLSSCSNQEDVNVGLER